MRILPFEPTTTNLPLQSTPCRSLVVPDVRLVHVMPLGDARIVPDDPTATICVPDQMISVRICTVPDVRLVHVTPSGDVRIVPFTPTATNCVPDQAML